MNVTEPSKYCEHRYGCKNPRGSYLPITEFRTDRRFKGGLSQYCKYCEGLSRKSELRRRDDFNPMDVVYFIQHPWTHFIKIGTTRDLTQRQKQLESQYGVNLNYLGFVFGGRKREQELHQRFKDRLVHTEWFRPHDDIMNFIREFGSEKHPSYVQGILRGVWRM